MSKTTLWNISVRTTNEAEEAVAALLERLFGQSASVYANHETRVSTVTVFSDKHDEKANTKRSALEAGLRYIADCGLNMGEASISIARVKREDWSESWKKYFKTIEVGRTLLIKPSWSKRKIKPGQAVVVLDPGLSFGTGQHPTTSFCLRQLVASHVKGEKRSFLDIGTGSGILALAAAKLGYAPVEAFDFDPVSVRIAAANTRKNRVESRIKLARKDLTRIPLKSRQQFDVICANLIDDLLIQESTRILNRLAPTGKLVLAGILTTQFPRVQKTYEALGLKMIATKVEGEWQSGAFVRAHSSPKDS